MQGLKGKVALVSGASRGYGRAIAERLARDGAFVVVHYATNVDAARAAVASIEAVGGGALPLAAPLDGSPAGVDVLFTRLDAELATRGRPATVDILVNNAAISPRGTIEDTSESLFDEVMNVDAKAPFFLLQKVLPRMPNGGRIINISSQTSLVAFPGVAAYTMAKGALDRLTLVAAKQLAPRNITVNVVAPGLIDTDMTKAVAEKAQTEWEAIIPLKRLGTPQDIAAAVCFLASDEAAYITGQVLAVNGGMYM